MSITAPPNSHILCREIKPQQHLRRGGGGAATCSVLNLLIKSQGLGFCGKKGIKRDCRVDAGFWPDLSRPTSVEMKPIEDSHHLDRILDEANQLSQPIIIDWMASWCRKCIYLKPKLEKLAADYEFKVKFYCVDVNKVPQALVKRGNISKMPTIQLWKDGEMKEEVIGGHKAWLVIEEVREMIQKFV